MKNVQKKSLFIAVSLAMISTITACSNSSSGIKKSLDNNDAVNEQVINLSQITVTPYSYGDGDKVVLTHINGKTLVEGNVNDKGEFLLNKIENIPANTPIIAKLVNSQGQMVLQSLYSASELKTGISITPLTTVVSQIVGTSDSNLITKRDNLLQAMSELGMIDRQNWSSLTSTVVDNGQIAGKISENSALQNFAKQVNDEVLAKNISTEIMRSGFPNAHGGIISLSVIDNGILNFMSGGNGTIHVQTSLIDNTSTNQNKVKISLENAPDWLKVENNVITYQAPQVNTRSSRETFKIVATSGGASRILEASYAINPAVILLSGNIGTAGGKLENQWKDIAISAESGALSQNYQVQIIASADESQRISYQTKFIPEITESDSKKLTVLMPSNDLIYLNYFKDNEEKSVAINQKRHNATQEQKEKDEQEKTNNRQKNVCFDEINKAGGLNTGFDYDFDMVLSPTVGNFIAEIEAFGVPLSATPRQRAPKKFILFTINNVNYTITDERCASLLMANNYNQDENREPVLFVHGFNPNGELAKANYWGATPKLVSELNIHGRKFQPYVFAWRTNARFDDVSRELAQAVETINKQTGKQVHIVAHSFGGLLTRTMVQGLSQASTETKDVSHITYGNLKYFEDKIASITTIGSPHSGISRTEDKVHGLPDGTDGTHGLGANGFCFAISCYQAGDKIDTFTEDKDSYMGGYASIIKKLRDNPYPNIYTQVLIGLGGGSKTDKNQFNLSDCKYAGISSHDSTKFYCSPILVKMVNNSGLGDGLISFHGQRFHPSLKNDPLIQGNYLDYPTVRERLLNLHYKTDLDSENEKYTKDIKDGEKIIFDPNYYSRKAIRRNGWATGVYSTIISDITLYHHELDQYRSVSHISSLNYYHIQQLSETGLQNCKLNGNYDQNCHHATWRYLKDFFTTHVAQPVAQPKKMALNAKILAKRLQNHANLNNTQQGIVDYTKAKVEVMSTLFDDVVLAQGYANADGTVSIPVEFIENNLSYKLRVSLPGYRAVEIDGEEAQIKVGATPEESSLDFGTIVLQPNEFAAGNIEVNVVDAFTGQPIADTVITANNSSKNTFQANGKTFNALPRGMYNVSVTKAGYETTTSLCTSNAYETTVCRIGMTPIFQTNQALVAKLVWDENPHDLDTHLIKYNKSGTQDYHIYYGNMRNGMPDNLDLDDTSSYGPETLSLDTLDPTAHYIYAIYHFSGSGSITSTSQTRVSVAQRGKPTVTFKAPTTGQGTWWKVFEVKNNVIIPCQSNCLFDNIPTPNQNNNYANIVNYYIPKWLTDMSAVIGNKK